MELKRKTAKKERHERLSHVGLEIEIFKQIST